MIEDKTTIDYILNIDPYSVNKEDKYKILSSMLKQLTEWHSINCDSYNRILKAFFFDADTIDSYYDIPFLPVRLFKLYDLLSINKSDIMKTMMSSGTSSQIPSKIFLDRETSTNQQKALVKIVSSFIGPKRLPMIIIDSPSVLKDRNSFSARGAGILGFSIFASDRIYAFNDDMSLNIEVISEFLEKHKDEELLLFGFTFMIWKYFYKELLNHKLDLSKGILIHGGGWKKLVEESVSSTEFKQSLFDVCGLIKIHDYYGMVEQTGSIYMECEKGHLHASLFSDIIIRRPIDFSIANIGEEGIIEVVSILPRSYPGHILLTEDKGILLGEDDCSCGRLGKYFKVTGRLQNAEIRGCSDTYESR